jgi:hypothetical protein
MAKMYRKVFGTKRYGKLVKANVAEEWDEKVEREGKRIEW